MLGLPSKKRFRALMATFQDRQPGVGLARADLELYSVLGAPLSHSIRRPSSVLVHLQDAHWSEVTDPCALQVLDELLSLLATTQVPSSQQASGAVRHHQHWLLLTLSRNRHPQGICLNSVIELGVLRHAGDRNTCWSSM